MKIVLFYEKPGCVTNAKQKKQLQEAGCLVLERDLLNNGLSAEELLAFFKPLHVSTWFNPNAPKIKNGEIDIKNISEEAALKMLMLEPILIRRPLIAIGQQKMSGFDVDRLERYLNISLRDPVGESCSNVKLTCND